MEIAWVVGAVLACLPNEVWHLLGSMAITTAHTLAEMIGVRHRQDDTEREPFWTYADRLTPIRVSDGMGYILFFGLALSLYTVAALGYIGEYKWSLALLFGLRVGDAIISHLTLWVIYRRPNPGLLTSILYLIEARYLARYFELSAAWTVVGFGIFYGFWLSCVTRLVVIKLRNLRRRKGN